MTWFSQKRPQHLRWIPIATLSFLIATIGHVFEPDVGLVALYQVRGELQPPEQAVIVGLDQAGVDWLAFNADRLDQKAPHLARCIPSASVDALAKASNVEDLPRGLIGCVLREIASRMPVVVVIDVHFYGSTDDANDTSLSKALSTHGNFVLLEKLEKTAEDGMFVREKPSAQFAKHAKTGFFLVEWRSGDIYRYVDQIEGFPDLSNLPRVAADAAGLNLPPARSTGTALRNFWLFGPAGTIPTISFVDILTRKHNGSFAGKTVFLGASNPHGEARRDDFETAWSSAHNGDLTGIELVATAFLNIAEGANVYRLGTVWSVLLATIIGMTSLSIALTVRGFRGIAVATGLAVIYGSIAAVAFSVSGLWLPVTAVLSVLFPLSVLLSLGRGYLDTSAILRRFLPASIATALIRTQARSRSAARTTEGTIIVIDLVGSTRIAESLGETEFSRQMTTFFNLLNSAIEAEQGMVLKYTGDGVLAVFDKAALGRSHASRALTTAVTIGQRLQQDFNKETPFSVRMGVHSGPFVLGEIGADTRTSFDALGDTVNVAARLEELAKERHEMKPATILASEYTILSAEGWRSRSLEIGKRNIRGREYALCIYEVLWAEGAS